MRRKKWTPYCRLPRRKQRDSFIRLRQKIRSTDTVYGGQFTSDQILNEQGRPALYNQWADFCFLGGDGLTLWNAVIITAVQEFWDTTEDMAHSQAWEMLTPEEQSAEAEMKFEPIWENGVRMYRLLEKPKRIYDNFEGLTYREYWDKLTGEIIRNEPPEVFESFKMDRSYRYGIGLNMVIPMDEINRASIEEAIHCFRGIGETDWRAAEPVPRRELPSESADAAFRRMKQEIRAQDHCSV